MEKREVNGVIRDCYDFKVVFRGGKVEHFDSYAEGEKCMKANRGSTLCYRYVSDEKEKEA